MRDDLTEREDEVLQLLAAGMSTAQMCEHLVVSAATVRNHVQSILYKLDVHSRIEAVAKYHEPPPTPAERVLRLLHREGYRLTDWQETMIREAFPSASIPRQPGPIVTTAYARPV